MKRSILVILMVLGILIQGYGMKINSNQTEMGEEKGIVTFGSGCFWCTEAIFERVNGVETVISGYSGGSVINPSYREVCNGTTGHAEVVQITYDPGIISFKELLEIFFKTHDPTTLNRQGADVGTQYRSVVFYHNEDQRIVTENIIKELNSAGIWREPIVTEVSPFENFYAAENYHQEYFSENPANGYCRMVIQPKVDKFTNIFKDKLK